MVSTRASYLEEAKHCGEFGPSKVFMVLPCNAFLRQHMWMPFSLCSWRKKMIYDSLPYRKVFRTQPWYTKIIVLYQLLQTVLVRRAIVITIIINNIINIDISTCTAILSMSIFFLLSLILKKIIV